MAGEPVARTAWYDAEGCVGVYNRARHLVDGAVASYSHNNIYAPTCAILCDVGCMTCIFCEHNLIVERLAVDVVLYQLRHPHLVVCTRMWVYYEYNFSLHVYYSMQN